MAETPHAETPLDRPAHAAEDWTVPQDWDRYSAADHAMWDRLFERQARMLPGRVVLATVTWRLRAASLVSP